MVRRRTKKYQNGDGFVLPLRDGGYARGVIARNNGKGIAFGYFFGPRLTKIEEADFDEVEPNGASLVGKFGDLALVNGEWSIVGTVPGWHPTDWLMPPLVRVDEVSGRAWLSFYDERSFVCLREQEIDPTMVAQFPYDRTMGAGSVEIRLTNMLK